MKYRKAPAARPSTDAILGMLYLIRVRLVRKGTGEKVKHRLLVIGHESEDLNRKLSWMFDTTKYESMSVTSVEKVREKIHFLSTTIEAETAGPDQVIKRQGGTTQNVFQPTTPAIVSDVEWRQFAVGIVTMVGAHNEDHALRKVGHQLVNLGGEGDGKVALSEGSTVSVEEVARPNGFASPRDVSNEINRAHFVRG